MSQKNQPKEEPLWGWGIVLQDYNFQHFAGEMLTHIEALGLPEKQEEAFKSVFKSTFWGFIDRNGFYITAEQHNRVREENKDMGQKCPTH